jgi:hypothetical protein
MASSRTAVRGRLSSNWITGAREIIRQFDGDLHCLIIRQNYSTDEAGSIAALSGPCATRAEGGLRIQ